MTNLAQSNPDALARNLLQSPKNLKDRRQRREIWDLFQQVGGDAVIRRAIQTILHARSYPELEAVLHAAAADGWYETGAAIAQRFHREAQRAAHSVPDVEAIERLRAIVDSACAIRAPLHESDIRLMLHHASPRVREIAASAVAKLRRRELVADCLPLCWEQGPARIPACEAVGLLGESEHAAQLWVRALAARKAHRQGRLQHLLSPLGRMGAFDIQIALRAWIIEDATVSAPSIWVYAEVWSLLTAAKFAAGACDRSEAIEDLRWFLNVAGLGRSGGTPPLPDKGTAHGYLFIARELSRLGATADSEALLSRFAAQGLPDVDHFPDLLFPGLRGYVPDDSNATLLWMAAMGNPDAQEQLLSQWLAALYQARTPDHWSIHASLDAGRVIALLRRALRSKAPGVLRHVLSLPMSDKVAAALRPQVEKLAQSHPSAVVRWKARRVLPTLPLKGDAGAGTLDPELEARWVRLDAAILSGATRVLRPRMPVAAANELPAGLLPPLHAGRGYRLEVSSLKSEARAVLLRHLRMAPLDQALDRHLPLGPTLEERPDVRAVRELPPPGNEIDQRMSELAQAVMQYWGEGEDLLTLDEEGVGLIATALSADAASLDDDDLEACGAFIGEALRKKVGGHWSGFDNHYVLEVKSESLDPHAWVREICTRKDILDGAEWLATRFVEAVVRLGPHKPNLARQDQGAACERILTEMCNRPPDAPMTELLREARSLSYRLEIEHWPAVLLSLDPLVGNVGVNRVLAAVSLYSPPEFFGRLWGRWGRARREESGILAALVEAMTCAAERDDMEAMPNWTLQPSQARLSFLNTLRKRMDAQVWQHVLLLLLRQRAAAGDREGTAWCLFSYRYEFSDCLPLLSIFLEMSVSGRQTVLRATLHSTRKELKLYRPLWAEALRDPAPAVVRAALDAAATHRARALRKLVSALAEDKREDVAFAANKLLQVWRG